MADSRDASSWRASSCQVVVEDITRKLRMSNTTLYRIPGHAGIKVNKEADKMAKQATRKNSDEPLQQEEIP